MPFRRSVSQMLTRGPGDRIAQVGTGRRRRRGLADPLHEPAFAEPDAEKRTERKPEEREHHWCHHVQGRLHADTVSSLVMPCGAFLDLQVDRRKDARTRGLTDSGSLDLVGRNSTSNVTSVEFHHETGETSLYYFSL